MRRVFLISSKGSASRTIKSACRPGVSVPRLSFFPVNHKRVEPRHSAEVPVSRASGIKSADQRSHSRIKVFTFDQLPVFLEIWSRFHRRPEILKEKLKGCSE